ncbi:MAG: leucine-rich repeat protein, partial [Clostridia bacterium]|nr:leucine-rich repeat protein [Clostridia bacterium]
VDMINAGECVEKGGAIYLSAGSTYNMSGGEVSGHFAEKGGALYISDGAVFTMTGGTITGNYAKYGGAIYVANGGECYINGGTITGNYGMNAPAIYVETGGLLQVSDEALVDGNIFLEKTTPINIYVDGTLSKKINATGDSYTLNEADMPIDYEHCCGYFLDSELRTTIKNDTIDLTSAGEEITFAPRTATAGSEGINIYTRTANPNNFTFTENTTTGTYDIKAKDTTISVEMVLPKEYNNVQTSIGDSAFYGCDRATGLIVPNGVTSIGSSAFSYCMGLTGELIIPDSVTSIGSTAFQYCGKVTGLIVSNSVISIGSSAFSFCSGLTSLTIGNSVTSIGNGAFYNCVGLTGELIIPDSVTSIGQSAFEACSKINGLVIPNSVISIGVGAFWGCAGLTSVTIPDSVTSIGENAFYNCVGLTEVKVTSGNTTYEDRGKNAIIEKSTNTIIQGFNCTDLSVLEEVTSIGDYAFYECSGLTGELIIPDSVTSIGYSAFYECSGLTGELIIPDSVTSIGNYAFDSCSGLTSVIIGNSVTSIGNYTFDSCSGLTSVIIGNSVTSIGNDAFFSCSGLTSVYIPSTATTISTSSYSRSPFYNCSSSLVIYTNVANAESIPSGWGTYWNYYANGEQLQVVYGCSLDSEGNIVTPKTINFYVDGVYHSSIAKAGTSYTVQESEMPLDYESCCGYFLDNELRTTIKNNTIDLSNGDVNLYTRTADPSLFSFTTDGTGGYIITKNTSVTYSGTEFNLIMPREYNGKTVTTIADSAFKEKFGSCGLVNIVLSSEITAISNCCFDTDQGDRPMNIGSVNLHNNIATIGDFAFSYCSGDFLNQISNSVTSIGDSAFSNCIGLTSVTIGDSVTSIGDSAFYYCIGLTGELIIPDSVTSIGNYAFQYCSGLTGELIIPDSVTSIGNYAFQYCSGLTSVTIGNNVTSIGSSAFSSCSGLTSVYLPSSVTTISASSYSNAPFYNCSSSLVIYTDVANTSSKPSGWNTYWNYYSSGSTLTVNYGYTLEQYKSVVGLTFAPDSENISSAVVEVVKESKAYQLDNSYLNEMLLDKREYVVLPKKQVKTA